MRRGQGPERSNSERGSSRPSVGGTKALLARFESLKSRGGGKELDKQATRYYNKVRRDRKKDNEVQNHRTSVLYNAEMMARVSEQCNDDRQNSRITNYVDIKTILIDEFGDAMFNMNKPFVTEFLVQNSRKILIEGLDTDVANDAVVPEHDAPLGFTKRVKELCGEAVAAGREPQYPKIKSAIGTEFGDDAAEQHKRLISQVIQGEWAPAPPPKRRGDSEASDSEPAPPPPPVRGTAPPPASGPGPSSGPGSAADIAAALAGVAPEPDSEYAPPSDGPTDFDGPDYAFAAQGDDALSDQEPGDEIYTAPVATAKPAAGDAVDEMYAMPAVTTGGGKFMRDRNQSVHVAMNRASDLYMDEADVVLAQVADGGGGEGDGELYAEQDANYADPDDMLNMFEGDSEADVEIARMLALMKRKEKKLDLSGFLEVELLEYDQDDGTPPRNRFLVQVKYFEQQWLLQKYYSDFAELSEKMMTSKKLNEYCSGLPEKHGVGLLLKKGMARLSINKGSVRRQETEFMMDRMKKLETWLQRFTHKFNCQDLQNEACVDEFFEIFFRVVQ